jgi:hypothetical protein
MEGSDVLLAICEVSIAFAGFTSIVGVLGQRGRADWDAEGSFRLWLMIESSLATLFFSLLPFSLHHFSLSEAVVWGVSSGALAGFLAIHLIVVSPKLQVLERGGQWSTRRFEPFTGVIMIATLVVLSLNAFGIGFDRSFGAYLLGLILFLGLASMHFVALLVAVHSSNSGGSD